MNTSDNYKIAVMAKYQEAKTGNFSGFLVKPSPAELKNLCLLLADKGISKQDEEIFVRFFDLNEASSLQKQIKHFDVDKFRPISNFLKGKTETTRAINLDLIAVLIDFNPRPYRKFLTGSIEELKLDVAVKEIVTKEETEEKKYNKSDVIFAEFKKKSVSKKMAIAAIPLFIFGTAGYEVKNHFFQDKNCMHWVENHFEAIDCDEVKNSADVSPFNQDIVTNFKKITVSDTTHFFKNGDTDYPLVWYGKSTNKKEYEYFNQPGLHPQTGKTLKPISKYIIRKYILKK